MIAAEFSQDRKEFLIKEYESLNEKMKYAVEDIYRTDMIISVAISGLFVWILQNSQGAGVWSRAILIVPAILALAGLIKQRARQHYVRQLEAYIRTVEAKFLAEGGWESFFDRRRSDHAIIYIARAAYWYLLLAACLAFALLGAPGALPKAGMLTP